MAGHGVREGPVAGGGGEQSRTLPAGSVLALAAGLAEGLNAIHAAGVVHRDLKPANVLLADDGPRMIDFGISRAVESSALTSTGLVVGSPGFMSPEQADGREVGPPSDIFSLGAVLAFAATGEGPFGSGSTPALVYRVVFGPPNLDRLPAEVRPLIARCLDKDPAKRPTAARLLAEAGAAYPGTGWLPAPVTRAFTQLSAPATRPAQAGPSGDRCHQADRGDGGADHDRGGAAAGRGQPRAQPGPATAAPPVAAAGRGGDHRRVPRGLGHGRLRPDQLSAPFTRRSIRAAGRLGGDPGRDLRAEPARVWSRVPGRGGYAERFPDRDRGGDPEYVRTRDDGPGAEHDPGDGRFPDHKLTGGGGHVTARQRARRGGHHDTREHGAPRLARRGISRLAGLQHAGPGSR